MAIQTAPERREVIVGVGLADRPRKSRWPARMDLAQSVSGLALGLFMYLVFSVITAPNPNDTSSLPINVLIASDHSAYIGIVTNVMLGLLTTLVLRAEMRRSWIGQLIFWGVNLGLIVFVAGLILDSAEIKRIGAPVMGIALLFSLAVLAWTALREPLETSEAELQPA